MRDVCPKCHVRLVWDEELKKFVCPTKTCEFYDRRFGNSMIEPALDRRGTRIATAWDSVKDFKEER